MEVHTTIENKTIGKLQKFKNLLLPPGEGWDEGIKINHLHPSP
jgi:hypothetical protein